MNDATYITDECRDELHGQCPGERVSPPEDGVERRILTCACPHHVDQPDEVWDHRDEASKASDRPRPLP